MYKCAICMECHILDKTLKHIQTYKCSMYVDTKNDKFYIENYLHPICHSAGDDVELRV